MNKDLVVFIFFIITSALVQTSFFPLPIGIALLLLWYLKKGFLHLILLAVIFSVSLGVLSNIPIWLVLLSTGLALYLFVFCKSLFPAKNWIHVLLFVASLVIWELSLYNLQRILNL